MDTILALLLWAIIGALPGFYIFYIKQQNPRLGVVLGAILGVFIGQVGISAGLIANPVSAVVAIFGLEAIVLLILPDNNYPADDNRLNTQQRRLFIAVGALLILIFLLYGLSALIPDLPVDPALLAFIAIIALLFFVPRGNHDRKVTNRQRITYLAYALTIPAVVIVMGIVIFPVIWNVIFSFRDITTADLADASLFDLSELNLDNYQSQMGFRIDPIPCDVSDETGECLIDEAGNIVYEGARRYIGDDYRGYREEINFDLGDTHYAVGFRNNEFYPMIFRTFFYTISSTVMAIIFGLVAALIVRDQFRGRAIFRGFILFPYIAPVISVAFIWQVLLRTNGLVNETLGTDIAFLSTRDTFLGVSIPLLMVILFQTWRYFPFAFLFLLARIQAIPDDMYEAAKVDGATPSQRLWFITLPQLRAVFGTLFLLRFIWTFNKFDDVFLLTGPIEQTKVIPVQIFEELFTQSNIGEASAIAVIMALMLTVVLFVYFRFFLVDEA